jgi:hypothetical protein
MTKTKGGEIMPRGNGTGPAGLGPMTGRGMGYCAGFNVPGFANRPGGFIRGCFGGRGRGLRNMYYLTGLPAWARYGGLGTFSVDEKALLESQQKALEEELNLIRKQLKKLEEHKDEDD